VSRQDVGVNVGGQALARREINRLDPLKVASLIKNKQAGRHADGGGLYLVVEPNGAARWAFLFRWRASRAAPGAGKLREMGLGSTLAVSLKKAREKAAIARGHLADGLDPIVARKAEEGVPTFGQVADELVAVKVAESRGKATEARLKRALEVYAADLRPMRVDQVDTEAVLGVLKPIWSEKAETAQKTRQLIEAVLSAAKARGWRTGENPAAWRGHLDHLLPKRSKLDQKHHAAMSRDEVPAFMMALRARDAMAARALEFLVLTAARAGEVLGATWDEIDLQAKVWVVPAERMKAGREHRVALSGRAVEILQELHDVKTGPLVFPGQGGKRMSGMSFDKLMARMKIEGVTTHGFRSSFRDWCGEVSTFPREVAEAALAHTVGDATERAYRRGDALEKRRKLMEAWAGFCSRPAGSVTPFQRRGGR
jgi:integrase